MLLLLCLDHNYFYFLPHFLYLFIKEFRINFIDIFTYDGEKGTKSTQRRIAFVYKPLHQTNIFPLESPDNTSPLSANAKHRIYLGFSCFCKKRKCTFTIYNLNKNKIQIFLLISV